MRALMRYMTAAHATLPRMRRYAVTEAPRALLAHELAELIRREEHLNPERPERAEAYRRALAEIEMGAPATTARRTEFRVNEYCSSKYGVCEGSRTELAAEIDRYGADRAQQGKVEKAKAIARALNSLGDGAVEVRVEGVVFRVVED